MPVCDPRLSVQRALEGWRNSTGVGTVAVAKICRGQCKWFDDEPMRKGMDMSW